MKQLLLLLVVVVALSSHDMFLKLDTYFLPPDKLVAIELVNGTFEVSENTIDRSRMLDVSILGNGKRTVVDTAQWSELGGATVLTLKTGAPGTYVVGVSTRARSIEMAAEDFNGYLEHDGITDELAARRADPSLNKDATELYAKHVKTIFQVGEKRTDDWSKPLGYPVEFVPLANPYELAAGDQLEVKLLSRGKPLANQLVYIGNDGGGAEAHTHADGDGAEHTHASLQSVRTNADGVLTAQLLTEGVWYLRTIELLRSSAPGLTHESNWATLTFEVGHDHDHSAHTSTNGDHNHGAGADHTHEHGMEGDHDHAVGGVPGYVFWIVGLAFFAGLFFWFNRRA